MLPNGKSMSCSLLVLLYGDFPGLHARCLLSVLSTTPVTSELRVGINALSRPALESLADILEISDNDVLGIDGSRSFVFSGRRVTLYSKRNENIKKYPMMRRMLADPAITTEWLAWFDDDTWIAQDSRWWDTAELMAEKPGNVYMGEPWSYPYSDKHQKFIVGRPWYRGRAFGVIAGKPGVLFCTGGFWMARQALLSELNWPDPAIGHNGGDTLLSEAIRQRGLRLTPFPTKQLGIHVNDHPRRGYREAPVGTV